MKYLASIFLACSLSAVEFLVSPDAPIGASTPDAADLDFGAYFLPESSAISGVLDRVELRGDANIGVYPSSAGFRTGKIVIDVGDFRPFSVASTAPSVFTVQDNLDVELVSEGSGLAIVTDGRYLVPVEVSVSGAAGVEIDSFQSWEKGGFGEALSYTVEDLMASAATPAALTFRTVSGWSESCYAYPILNTLTGIVTSEVGRARVLVTPQHLIGTRHSNYVHSIGETMIFQDESGALVSRTILSRAVQAVFTSDIAVYTLSEPTALVPFFRLLPPEALEVVSGATPSYPLTNIPDSGIPVLGTHKTNKVSVFYLTPSFPSDDERIRFLDAPFYSDGIPAYPTYSDFELEAQTGTSGNPIFTVVNGVPVLISLFSGPTNGPDLSSLVDEINTLILAADASAGVSTGYTVTVLDLSEYPNTVSSNYAVVTDDGSVTGTAGKASGLYTEVVSPTTWARAARWDDLERFRLYYDNGVWNFESQTRLSAENEWPTEWTYLAEGSGSASSPVGSSFTSGIQVVSP